MTGRGRPPIGPATTIRLEPELRADLQAIADEFGWSLAALIRDILRQSVALTNSATHASCGG